MTLDKVFLYPLKDSFKLQLSEKKESFCPSQILLDKLIQEEKALWSQAIQVVMTYNIMTGYRNFICLSKWLQGPPPATLILLTLARWVCSDPAAQTTELRLPERAAPSCAGTSAATPGSAGQKGGIKRERWVHQACTPFLKPLISKVPDL